MLHDLGPAYNTARNGRKLTIGPGPAQVLYEESKVNEVVRNYVDVARSSLSPPKTRSAFALKSGNDVGLEAGCHQLLHPKCQRLLLLPLRE
jgi:hypothetical protein